jgi:hypothetical protein
MERPVIFAELQSKNSSKKGQQCMDWKTDSKASGRRNEAAIRYWPRSQIVTQMNAENSDSHGILTGFGDSPLRYFRWLD